MQQKAFVFGSVASPSLGQESLLKASPVRMRNYCATNGGMNLNVWLRTLRSAKRPFDLGMLSGMLSSAD